MKKVLIALALLVVASTSYAQKGKVTSASNYMESGNLAKALETIELTIDESNPKSVKTIGWPKTWEVRGSIFKAINSSKDEKIKSLSENPLDVSYDSFMKAVELDTDGRYKNSLKINLTLLIQDLTQGAVDAFKEDDFAKATKYFENILAIEETEMFKADTPIDTVIIYNTGLAATNAKMYDKAINYFQTCIKHDYKGASAYGQIIGAYQELGDTLKAVDTMKEGFEKYPEDQNILIQLINYYINANKSADAITYLDKAIAKDTSNPTFYFAKGAALDKLGRPEDALKAYTEATEVDPEFADAYYNIGVVYYNRGVKQLEVANAVPTNEPDRYESEKAKADVEFEKAIPYMEKASSLNESDIYILDHLKNLYYRLKMMDKFNEINDKIEGEK